MLNCFLPSALVSSFAMAHSYHASIIVSTATRMLMLLMLKSRIVGFDVGRSFLGLTGAGGTAASAMAPVPWPKRSKEPTDPS